MKTHRFWPITGALFVLGVVASLLGATVFKVNLYEISENLVIANMVYITFVILIVERVLESYNSSLRKPKRQILVSAIENTKVELKQEIEQKAFLQETNANYADMPEFNEVITNIRALEHSIEAQNEALLLFKHETRETLLLVSVVMGGVLSATGCLNVFSPFIDGTLFVGTEKFEGLHRALFEGFCVAVSGWIVAGGSEGWNSVTKWVEGNINPNKP